MNSIHEYNFMQRALEEAENAKKRDEVPIGAVLVDREANDIIASAGNRTRELNDPTAHAEILVIREGCQHFGAQRIPRCDLYVTLEPCTMCAAAISFARIGKLFYGAKDAKGGAIDSGVQFFEQSSCHHKIEIHQGLLEGECGIILKEFFAERR